MSLNSISQVRLFARLGSTARFTVANDMGASPAASQGVTPQGGGALPAMPTAMPSWTPSPSPRDKPSKKVHGPRRRSVRRALLSSPSVRAGRGTSQGDSAVAQEGGVATPRVADIGAAEAPAGLPGAETCSELRRSEGSTSDKDASKQAAKKAKLLLTADAVPATPAVLREELASLSVLPAPCSLLDEGVMQAAIEHLRATDPGLAVIIEQHTAPSYASHQATLPFQALVRSIVYQQLAGKAAATIHSRLVDLLRGPERVTPACLLALSAEQLRTAGISRQKASYLHDLAGHFKRGALSDGALLGMDDEALMHALTAVKGIGEWTAHMFMMFTLHRPDVLPTGDLGVRKGFQKVFGLSTLPTPRQMLELAEPWRPYRSVGSLYMWKLQDTPLPATIS